MLHLLLRTQFSSSGQKQQFSLNINRSFINSSTEASLNSTGEGRKSGKDEREGNKGFKGMNTNAVISHDITRHMCKMSLYITQFYVFRSVRGLKKVLRSSLSNIIMHVQYEGHYNNNAEAGCILYLIPYSTVETICTNRFIVQALRILQKECLQPNPYGSHKKKGLCSFITFIPAVDRRFVL